jgi:hypothetical protein
VTHTKRSRLLVAGAVAATSAVSAAAVTASPPSRPALTSLPSANTRSDGYAPASVLSPELTQVVLAQGSMKLENPSALTSYYGYDNDVVNAAGQSQMLPTPTTANEAKKTEPDKNTFLSLRHGLPGADPNYDYGQNFLFQGHEGGANGAGYITRINLDADAAHRVTLVATQDANGKPLSTLDGSTWDPFSQRLLLTSENPSTPTYAATTSVPSTVTDVSGALGRGGYEGIQDDSHGNLWIVEDIGGSNKPGTVAKRPNSFVYRYVPAHPGDLAHGKLQALQVLDNGAPVTFESQAPLNSPDQVALHTYKKTFATRWVTVHDTATDGSTPFNANDAAKKAQATPFKRPENGQFRPGSGFKDFYFDETGDTNATSVENPIGGWTSVFKLSQPDPSSDTGTLSLFYKGDQAHAGFDNLQFLSRDKLGAVEDAGDTLHAQRNALDSGYVLDARADYSDPAAQPVRWLAQGRDASATIDSANAGFGKNDGDNEITGLHVSDGDPTAGGILGAKVPALGDGNWRWFYTQQHGDNVTYEVKLAGTSDHHSGGEGN